MIKLEKLVTREENFAEWYTSIINNAQLCVYGDIKGTIIFQPKAWAIWEHIQSYLNKEFGKLNIKNVALPLLISSQEFKKEKKHLEGFAPECFIVNHIGDKQLEQPYIIRPTSEILFCKYFAHVISSYKSLPFKVNQWCSVMRGEKNTRPFLRNSEFHWQEMHSVHVDEKDALLFSKKLIDIYQKLLEDILCIPILKGEKTIGERFAGAQNTYTVEGLMQDGQVLQCGTSHYLGQNFSKIYNIKFQNKKNTFDYVHQVSAGISTRLLGAIIMVHGDDNGLILPPEVAATQILINTIGSLKNSQISKIANNIKKALKKYRVEIDDSDKGLGYKLSQGEIDGIPIQIIVGRETIENNNITIVRRDTMVKENISLDDLRKRIPQIINDYKSQIFQRASKRLNDAIVEANNIDQLKQILDNKKIAKCYWAGDENDEKKIKELTNATPRCIIAITKEKQKCFYTHKSTNQVVIFARAY